MSNFALSLLSFIKYFIIAICYDKGLQIAFAKGTSRAANCLRGLTW